MKVNTAELSGVALDYAVAVAQGATNFRFDTVSTYWVTLDGEDRALSSAWSEKQNWNPSTNWNQGGPIIDCLDMQFWKWGGAPREEMQCAATPVKEEFGLSYTTYFGKSKLIAGLRAYVASKLGDEVEIPNSLIRKQK